MPISVKLVVDYHGRVLLLKNERDEWELPGGKLEVGESPEDSVRREVAKELGLTVTGVDIIDSWVYEITPLRHVFIVSYGTRHTGEEVLTFSGEHKELGLFDYTEVPGLRMPEPTRPPSTAGVSGSVSVDQWQATAMWRRILWGR